MAADLLPHICGAGLFLLLVAVDRTARSTPLPVLILWNLPGVILHELMHLLAGYLLRAGPTGLSLLPVRTGSGWRLARVSFSRINTVNAVPVALAPLGLAAVAWFVADSWFLWWRPGLLSTMSLYAALFFLLYNALPSRQDLRIACHAGSLLLYGTLAAAGTWLWGGTIVTTLVHPALLRLLP